MAHGATYLEATKQALSALEGAVVKQTYLLSYLNAFLLIAILNACCVPLVIVTIKRRKKGTAKPVAVTVSDH